MPILYTRPNDGVQEELFLHLSPPPHPMPSQHGSSTSTNTAPSPDRTPPPPAHLSSIESPSHRSTAFCRHPAGPSSGRQRRTRPAPRRQRSHHQTLLPLDPAQLHPLHNAIQRIVRRRSKIVENTCHPRHCTRDNPATCTLRIAHLNPTQPETNPPPTPPEISCRPC